KLSQKNHYHQQQLVLISKHFHLTTAFAATACLQVHLARLLAQQIDMSYPKVTIVNSTPYVARGQVDYLSLFCSDDGYTVSANGATWTGPDRGVCLVKRVSATLNTPQGNVEAEAYTSSGTAYSQYAIIYQPNGNGFAVTRIVS
ncbi:hypothetical protein Vafri_20570, partial [Volvox africanus]